MASTFNPMRMTAATEDAAIAQVLQLVGATRDAVSVEVLSQSDKGVTVRVSPRRDDEPQETTAETPEQSPAEIDRTPTEEFAVESADEILSGDENADDEATEESIDDATEVVAGQSAPTIEARVEETEVSAKPEREALPPLDEATQQRAVETSQSFLDRMGLEAQATIGDNSKDQSARLLIDIDGEDVGILIGKHGQTLQSFQYLLNVTLNNAMEKEAPEGERSAVRVVIDAGGYRARRLGSLQQSARDAASRVKRDSRPFRMEPMPAHERRLVHMELQNDSELATSSEGREPMRYVVVAPAGYVPPEGGAGFNRGARGASRGGRGNFNRGR